MESHQIVILGFPGWPVKLNLMEQQQQSINHKNTLDSVSMSSASSLVASLLFWIFSRMCFRISTFAMTCKTITRLVGLWSILISTRSMSKSAPSYPFFLLTAILVSLSIMCLNIVLLRNQAILHQQHSWILYTVHYGDPEEPGCALTSQRV